MRQTLKHCGNTARSSGTTHVKRSLARRRPSTRSGSLQTPSTSWKPGERITVLNNSRTRAAKTRAQEKYTAVDREVKRRIKKDKRDYIDDLARQAETAAGQGNMRDLYLVTKKLTGKFQQTDKPVMDKNVNPLTTTNEQLKRWAEHFRELLNRPTPDSPPDIPAAETELPVSCDKPSKAEIKNRLRYQQKPSKQT